MLWGFKKAWFYKESEKKTMKRKFDDVEHWKEVWDEKEEEKIDRYDEEKKVKF